MRYTIHHRTRYLYEEKASYSHHLARLMPRELPWQRCLGARVMVSPTPEVMTRHTDYFQNPTTYFSVTTPHEELVIDSYSEVEMQGLTELQLNLCPSWESVRDRMKSCSTFEDFSAVEFVSSSPLCAVHPELESYARMSFSDGAPVLEAAADLTHRIHRDFSFDATATTVSTPVLEVFRKRAGVCQDFAHLQISMLRTLGLPARYVSGYLRTEPPPGQPRLVGADASHAWVAIYVPDFGWLEFDATNDNRPQTDHVRVAFGRDYHDISPIRGTVFGGGAQRLEIGVTVTPV